jgi:hypothetical protein
MVPDIPFLSIHTSSKDLLASFNTQDQAPDDPHDVQNPQFSPCDLFPSSDPFSQVLLRISTKCHILPLLLLIMSQGNSHLPPRLTHKTSNQGFWRSVVYVQRLWIRFVRQDLACVHIGDSLFHLTYLQVLYERHMMCSHF